LFLPRGRWYISAGNDDDLAYRTFRNFDISSAVRPVARASVSFGRLCANTAIDVVKLGRGDRLLRLHQFNALPDARLNSLPRQIKRLFCDLKVFSCHADLVGCGLHIEVGLAGLALYLQAEIAKFRLSLGQSSTCLFDVALYAAALPNGEAQCPGHRKRAVGL
jgi:hypothetical protein